jgi:hypothetical protein
LLADVPIVDFEQVFNPDRKETHWGKREERRMRRPG